MKKFLSYLHPFLFTLYPILELRNHNITYVSVASLVRPVLLSLLFTTLTWILWRLLLRDGQKAGIITTLAVILFFSYGHVFIQIESTFGVLIRHRHLMLIYAGTLVLSAIFIIWKVKKLGAIVRFLTVTGGILVIFSTVSMLQHDLSVHRAAQRSNKVQGSLIQTVSDTSGSQKPDIYLILLDAHTSIRTLEEEFNYDAATFQHQLEDLGFYVAECAQSNYPITKLSVTALFYANYDQDPALSPLSSSLVIETLRSQGYQVITFENSANDHFTIDEDRRLSGNQTFLSGVNLMGGLSEFEVMLWKTSLARIAYDMPQLINFDIQRLQKWEYYEHYQQTHFILNELKHLPEVESPKFVFAHIMVPHPPFIFAPDGEFVWADGKAEGYVASVRFIDSQIVPVVAEIIKNSKTPPVIILMGDHGAVGIPKLETPQRRMSILNAFYVNDQAKSDLYKTITPVNTFRIVLNNYFGTDFPLLEDLSYHSSRKDDFTSVFLVPNECQASP
jgi:hypothetical protein